MAPSRSNASRRQGAGKSRQSTNYLGRAQHFTRSLAFRPASEDAAYSLWRVGERRLKPALKCPIGNVSSLVLRHNFKQRIHPCLDRPLAQQIAAEGMNGVDSGKLELLQRLFEARPLLGSAVLAARSISVRSRSFISPAAFSVNVTATMLSSVPALRG